MIKRTKIGFIACQKRISPKSIHMGRVGRPRLMVVSLSSVFCNPSLREPIKQNSFSTVLGRLSFPAIRGGKTNLRELSNEEEDEDADEEAGGLVGVPVPGLVLHAPNRGSALYRGSPPSWGSTLQLGRVFSCLQNTIETYPKGRQICPSKLR